MRVLFADSRRTLRISHPCGVISGSTGCAMLPASITGVALDEAHDIGLADFAEVISAGGAHFAQKPADRRQSPEKVSPEVAVHHTFIEVGQSQAAGLAPRSKTIGDLSFADHNPHLAKQT